MKLDISMAGLSKTCLDEKKALAEKAMDRLWSGEQPGTGWVKLPLETTREELEPLLDAAAQVQNQCDLMIVLGAGGSSLGAKAVMEGLGPTVEGYPRLLFAGDNLDGATLLDAADQIRREETCLCVISKSGNTVETWVAFSILKETLKEKYGEAWRRRVYVITDPSKGNLRQEAETQGYRCFGIPEDIGGRYSVLTPVGLFPLAVGGVDIMALLAGAKDMASDPGWDRGLSDYALARLCLGESGKTIEALESFDPSLETFGQWLKQLFGESEGKEGKGIYPTVLSFTRDLHSVGQYLQEGRQVFFETMILVDRVDQDVVIPSSAGPDLAGLTLGQINRCVSRGVIAAHAKEGIPLITVEIPQKDAYHMGQLIGFFQLSCGLSANMIGVNPFNQPGVERYKQEAREEIRKEAEKVSQTTAQLV